MLDTLWMTQNLHVDLCSAFIIRIICNLVSFKATNLSDLSRHACITMACYYSKQTPFLTFFCLTSVVVLRTSITRTSLDNDQMMILDTSNLDAWISIRSCFHVFHQRVQRACHYQTVFEIKIFFLYALTQVFFLLMKMNDLRGDLTNSSAKKERLVTMYVPFDLSAGSQVWVALCKHVCKKTFAFFDAVQGGKVEDVQQMVDATPKLLLQRNPGTMWTAAHMASEQGDFQMTMVLFDVAERLDRVFADAPTMRCWPLPFNSTSASTQMLHACTEKNLTPLMRACKRGCVPVKMIVLHE